MRDHHQQLHFVTSPSKGQLDISYAPGASLLQNNYICKRTTAGNGKVENENIRGSGGDQWREIYRICNPVAAKPNNIVNKRAMALYACRLRQQKFLI